MSVGPARTGANAVELHSTLAATWNDGYLSPTFSCRLVAIKAFRSEAHRSFNRLALPLGISFAASSFQKMWETAKPVLQ